MLELKINNAAQIETILNEPAKRTSGHQRAELMKRLSGKIRSAVMDNLKIGLKPFVI